MTVTGVLPCWTSTMVIDSIKYTLLMMNCDARMMMFDLGIILISLREEIEVEFILDCLYAKNKTQKTTDALNIMANSVLEFIWKIGDQSTLYTTDSYQQKLKMYDGL